MRKFFIFCIVCCASVMTLAEANNWAQQLVHNIAADVSISAEQTQQLQIAADEYITAMQQANLQYTDDTERTKAKEVVFKTYQSSLQEILTEEQYTELMRVREERRNQHLTH